MLNRHQNKQTLSETPFAESEISRFLVAYDSSNRTGYFAERPIIPKGEYIQSSYPANKQASGTLFFFDPNQATPDDFQHLGLSEKAIHTILQYRNKGGTFRNPEDLRKIYTLPRQEADRLIPFIQIQMIEKDKQETIAEFKPVEISELKEKSKNRIELDINKADSISWLVMPGIGPARASAILKYRKRLGGYISIDQLKEISVLPDSIIEHLKANLVLEDYPINKISINEATENELKNHPYIGWQIAKIIVAYRSQHGSYKNIDDLLNIHIIKKEWLELTKPYLTVK